ncbi:MAG: hypothetical protein NT051_01470, partial [Candidatus Micrarchaeota archaeon]|nr:hypothetical protein [Candidatus Micrarchaeota archaeon]
YIAVAVLFIAYLLSGIWLLGALIGLAIVWLVILECMEGVKQHGMKNELRELVIALAVALGIWFGAGFLLQTSSPLNAIVSCSMLPNIQRGDMVILSGDRIQAPRAEIENFDGLGDVSVYQNGVQVARVNGSFYAYCAQQQKMDALCTYFVSNPEGFTEKNGPLSFGYEKCEIVAKAGRLAGPCISYLEVNGKKYYGNISNDVVVYQPKKEDYYARVGDIIHRAYIVLKTSNGQEYVLTKGDNNPIFDIQAYDAVTGAKNSPVELSRTKGRIILGVPYVGYLKLFISPSAIPTPAGCDQHYAKYDS